VIFIFIVTIHLPWVDFSGIALPDTKGYLDVSANWFTSEHIYIRPIVYPIFLFFAKLIKPSEFGVIVYIQIFFYALSAVIFYKLLIYRKIKINKYTLLFFVIISFSAPQALYFNQIVLPETLPLFFILLLIHFLLQPASFKNSLIITFLIILPILLKPLWLLLMLFPLLKFIYSEKNRSNLIFGFLFPTLLTIILYSTNQFAVAKSEKNTVTASTFDMNTNLSLIRMGMIDADKNSRLLELLKHKKLIVEVSNRTRDNSNKEFLRFTEIKDQIPSSYREDSSFWKSILLKKPNNLLQYVSFQISRVPAFFSTSAANYKVKFFPNILNRMYQSFFYNIHAKHIAGICFLLFTFIIGLFNFKIWTLHKIFFFLIIGVTTVICLLVYQNPHFLRMRAVIEPLILYITLYTLFKTFEYLKTVTSFKLKKNHNTK